MSGKLGAWHLLPGGERSKRRVRNVDNLLTVELLRKTIPRVWGHV